MKTFKEIILGENVTGVYNAILSFDIDKNVAEKYANMIIKDKKQNKLTNVSLKSRLDDIIHDEKNLKKLINMIMDEL